MQIAGEREAKQFNIAVTGFITKNMPTEKINE